MTIESALNLGLPAAPLAQDANLNGELQIVYNALRILQQALNDAGIPSGGVTPAPGTLAVINGGTGVATITGLIKGNGISPFSAASSGTDYAPATSGTSILYGNGSGGFSSVTIGTGISFVAGTLSAAGSGGDVVGPASATDNAVARFDGTTGELIQNSVVTISDTGATTGVTTLGASTSVTTPIVQASNSAGLSLKNASGTTQMSVGAGGGDNMAVNVSTNLNGTNAQIDISPTGTGHVHIKPTGTGSVEVAPTNVGTIDNMTIGATTAKNANFVDLSVTGTLSFDSAQGTVGQVLTSSGTGLTPTWTTPTTGTVTSVGGTGTVNGLTLTGTVTSSGNLTLGGTLDLSSPPAIGGTSAASGKFTTLGVTALITSTLTSGEVMKFGSPSTGTGIIYMDMFNTSGGMYLGIEGSAGGSLWTNIPAYATGLGGRNGGGGISFSANAIAQHMLLTTSGLAVTGTLSATSTLSTSDTTDASSTTTGALKTAGGLAVAKKVYVGDNVVPAASKGVNFTGNTPAAGMTSQLLNWYEEGTWTPTLSAAAGTITTPGASTATYTRVGRNVTLSIDAAITINGTAALALFITGIPFAGSTATVTYYSGSGEERSTGFALSVEYQPSNSRISVYTYAGLYPGGNNTRFIISITYQV